VVPAWLTLVFIVFSPVHSTPMPERGRDGSISIPPPSGERGPAAAAAVASAVMWQSEHGQQSYQQQCLVCHGAEGKGDGPVAAALKPPPANFTNFERMDSLTNEDLLETISKGKGSMPGFAGVLKPEDMTAVVEYIRSLDDREK
jgi:mono/diheme cytochrome c family protein